MKKRLLFGCLCAAILSQPAFAHRINEWSFAKELTTASNLVAKTSATNDPKTWWVTNGAVNQQSFGAKVGTSEFEKGICATSTSNTYTWNATNTKVKNLRNLALSVLDFDNIKIQVITGTNFSGTTSKEATVVEEYTPNPHVKVTMEINSIPMDAAGTSYKATINFGTPQDDVRLVQELQATSYSVNTPDGKMFDCAKSIVVKFSSLTKNQDWVCLKYISLKSTSKGRDSHWAFPTLALGKQTHGLQAGEIRIQAEDFDEPWINNRTAHSAALYNDWAMASINNGQLQDGYGYPNRDREYDSTCSNAFVHVMNMAGYTDGLQQFQGWASENGVNDWDGNRFGFPNFAQQDWQAGYDGALESDGTATLDNLANYYGSWAEYTFDVKELLYADFSLRTALHAVNFNAYKAPGANKSPNVTGENVNYFNKYGGAYRIYVDGKPIRSNWTVRPSSLDNIATFQTLESWLPNTEPEYTEGQSTMEVSDETSRSYFCYAIPNLPHDYNNTPGTTWSPVYKSEIGNSLYESGYINEKVKDWYNVPDFANVLLTPGKHTLKVQSMGGRTSFDEIKVQAHSEPNTTGIDRVTVGLEQLGNEDAPVEFYNLQGVRVANPQGGIFIRRQGSKVTKVVIR